MKLTHEQIVSLRKASAVLCGTGHHDEASAINALLAAAAQAIADTAKPVMCVILDKDGDIVAQSTTPMKGLDWQPLFTARAQVIADETCARDETLAQQGAGPDKGPLSRNLRTPEVIADTAGAKPVATLHDDGYYTWHGSKPEGYERVGWRMAVYANPCADTCNFYVEGRACACRTSMAATIVLLRERIEELERDIHFSQKMR